MKENWGGTPGPVVTGEVIFVKVSKPIIFLVKSFLGNFYRHLSIFSGHTALERQVALSRPSTK